MGLGVRGFFVGRVCVVRKGRFFFVRMFLCGLSVFLFWIMVFLDGG